MRWVLIVICVVLPSVPATLLLLPAQSPERDVLGTMVIFFLGLWIMFGAASLFIGWSHSREAAWRTLNAVYISYLILCYIPALLAGVWLFSGPYFHLGSLQIFAMACLLPLCFNLVWDLRLKNLRAGFTWTELMLLVPSALIGLALSEVALRLFLVTDPFVAQIRSSNGNLAVNSPDRSYWYIVRKMGSNGANQANSFGFLGPEPSLGDSALRVLLIGNSIPAAGRSVAFPRVAEALYSQETGEQIEIVNASIAGYSLEQMRRYYNEKLDGLSYDILIVSFYLDDINRETRYQKNNLLYTPSWPEWMQDIYYHCVLCRSLLRLRWFTEGTFLLYRTRSYENAFPAALMTLDGIRVIAERRGAKFSVFNIPVFSWSNTLSEESEYEFFDMNKRLELWCTEKRVPCHDLLPMLVGKDIRTLRVSDNNIHFNDSGHKVVGVDLKNFLKSLRNSVIGH